MSKPKINLIYAISQNGIIGNAGGIPWFIPNDLQRFKELTVGKVVVMGRKTWESLPAKARPLPDRINIVISSNSNYEAEGATVVNSCSIAKEMAIIKAEAAGIDEVWIIGGEGVYDSFAHVADMHYVTLVHHHYDGDARGPVLDGMQLRYIDRQPVYQPKDNSPPLHYSYAIFARRVNP